ncbi:Predicted protein (fragment) [Nostocoides jenkinsii Ben 74]|uniref:Uncharacterized protein n=1 Tax=Nostocoides jenkinsii Ben 74 TaxID=1193518 RepID=A0A077M6A6_9MICO
MARPVPRRPEPGLSPERLSRTTIRRMPPAHPSGRHTYGGGLGELDGLGERLSESPAPRASPTAPRRNRRTISRTADHPKG